MMRDMTMEETKIVDEYNSHAFGEWQMTKLTGEGIEIQHRKHKSWTKEYLFGFGMTTNLVWREIDRRCGYKKDGE